MNPLFDTYHLFAGIAVSFAGFGTIAISLGKRDGGDDAKVDAHRLTNMLTASLTLAVVALMPNVCDALGLTNHWQLAVPAIVVLLVTIFAAPGLARRNIAVMRAPGYSRLTAALNLASIIAAELAFLACVTGWPGYRPEAVFLLGLMGLLVSSIIMFSRVAMSLLLPHNTA